MIPFVPMCWSQRLLYMQRVNLICQFLVFSTRLSELRNEWGFEAIAMFNVLANED